jgi:hypothetical protein
LHGIVSADHRFFAGDVDLVVYCIDTFQIREKKTSARPAFDNYAIFTRVEKTHIVYLFGRRKNVYGTDQKLQLFRFDCQEPGVSCCGTDRILDDLMRYRLLRRLYRSYAAAQLSGFLERYEYSRSSD